MNWKEIEKNYPKAFAECLFYFKKQYDEQGGYKIENDDLWINNCTGSLKFNNRDLYDFFDEQGVNVAMSPEHYKNGINWLWQLLWYLPKSGGTCWYGDNAEYPTRQKAETAAFEKSFEILEKMLID